MSLAPVRMISATVWSSMRLRPTRCTTRSRVSLDTIRLPLVATGTRQHARGRNACATCAADSPAADPAHAHDGFIIIVRQIIVRPFASDRPPAAHESNFGSLLYVPQAT